MFNSLLLKVFPTLRIFPSYCCLKFVHFILVYRGDLSYHWSFLSELPNLPHILSDVIQRSLNPSLLPYSLSLERLGADTSRSHSIVFWIFLLHTNSLPNQVRPTNNLLLLYLYRRLTPPLLHLLNPLYSLSLSLSICL